MIKNTYRVNFSVLDDSDGDILLEHMEHNISAVTIAEAERELLWIVMNEWEPLEITVVIHSIITYWNEL